MNILKDIIQSKFVVSQQLSKSTIGLDRFEQMRRRTTIDMKLSSTKPSSDQLQFEKLHNMKTRASNTHVLE